MTEDWAKDFSGLEKLREIEDSEIKAYKKAADAIGIRIEFITAGKDYERSGRSEVQTPVNEDLTLFWKALNKFQ